MQCDWDLTEDLIAFQNRKCALFLTKLNSKQNLQLNITCNVRLEGKFTRLKIIGKSDKKIALQIQKM